MRLTSFTLENYGNFRRLELHLDPDPGRINLIVAPNGAGKTVVRTAFRDWPDDERKRLLVRLWLRDSGSRAYNG